LKLKYETLLSSFAFSFNFRRYMTDILKRVCAAAEEQDGN